MNCRKAEACAWMCASIGLFYFGNGEHDTLHVLRHDPRIRKLALCAAVVAGAVNILVFLYVNIWVKYVQGFSQDPELAVSWAIPLATTACLSGFTSLLVACWGVWSWVTPVVVSVHMMALIMSITFLPGFGTKERKQ